MASTQIADVTTKVTTQPDLSISIVSHNAKEYLRECLCAVYENTHGISFEVIVVDNASTDDCAEMVRREFADAEVIANDINLGFSKANNQALGISNGRYVLLLNSDTEVTPYALYRMVEFMDENPRVGALGCKLLNSDGSLQPSCRSFPSLRTLLIESFFLDRFFPKSKLFGEYAMSYWDHNSILEVDQPMGACLIVRRETMEEVGVLDEQFFIFFEEVDWCYRIKAAGWKICFIPNAEVIHHKNITTRRVPLKMAVEWHRSRYKYFKKRYPHLPPAILKLLLSSSLVIQISLSLVPLLLVVLLLWRLI